MSAALQDSAPVRMATLIRTANRVGWMCPLTEAPPNDPLLSAIRNFQPEVGLHYHAVRAARSREFGHPTQARQCGALVDGQPWQEDERSLGCSGVRQRQRLVRTDLVIVGDHIDVQRARPPTLRSASAE